MTMTSYFSMADGDDPMAKKDHYRKYAVYMLDLASRASSDTDKLRLLVMAEAWLDMAVCTHRVAREHDNGPKGSGCVAMILSEAKKYHMYARECLKLAEADETDVPEWLIELSRIWMNAALTEEMRYFNKIEGRLDDRFHDSGPCSGTSDAKMRELQRHHMIRMLETLD